MANSKMTRLLGTLLLLRSKEWVSSRDLAERFDVSLRTVYRDIEVLQQNGVPIQGVPGPDGGYRLQTEDPLDPLLFSSNEALNLYLLGAGSSNLPENLERRAEKIVGKIDDVIRPEDAELLQKTSSRTYFDTSDWYWRDEATGWMPLLRQSIFEEKILLINHKQRGSDDIENVRVAPYGLVWKGGEWYLVGNNIKSGNIERFRVSRIAKVEVTEDSFLYPKDFILQTWWVEDVEQFGKGDIRVRLLVQKEAQSEVLRLATKQNSSVEYQGDVTLITLYVDKWRWLVPLVLSYAGSIYVEEPADLRQAIIDAFMKGLSRYVSDSANKEQNFVNDDSRLRATRGRVS